MPRRKQQQSRSEEEAALDRDAQDLHKAVSELVRVYQFRDRKCIYYYDVSVTQCYALSALLSLGPATLNDLAAKLYLDKSTASRVVDSLEKKGYIRRSVDSSDARALSLEVTEKGRNLHRRIIEDLVEGMKVLIEDLDPEVRKATASLVTRLAKAAADRFSKKEQAPGNESGETG